MQLTVIGSGDAFSAGGRLQPCFHLAQHGAAGGLLLDCGASVLAGLDRAGIDPNTISNIVITHLHGDHFAGLVWMLLHGQYRGRRETALEIAGPPGLAQRLTRALDVFYPGFTSVERRFALTIEEVPAGATVAFAGGVLQTFEVSHPSGAPSTAVKFSRDGKAVGYSGDTEWVEVLVDCADETDLFITECYAPGPPVKYHMRWDTLESRLDDLRSRQVLVTHMSPAMLEASKSLQHPRVMFAHDGMVLDV